MDYKDKIIRAKKRIDFLRQIHGLKKKEIFAALGFSRQYYYQSFLGNDSFAVKELIGITDLLGISEYDLIHSTDEEFNELPIVKAYYEYSKALATYEGLKRGIWKSDPFIKIGS